MLHNALEDLLPRSTEIAFGASSRNPKNIPMGREIIFTKHRCSTSLTKNVHQRSAPGKSAVTYAGHVRADDERGYFITMARPRSQHGRRIIGQCAGAAKGQSTIAKHPIERAGIARNGCAGFIGLFRRIRWFGRLRRFPAATAIALHRHAARCSMASICSGNSNESFTCRKCNHLATSRNRSNGRIFGIPRHSLIFGVRGCDTGCQNGLFPHRERNQHPVERHTADFFGVGFLREHAPFGATDQGQRQHKNLEFLHRHKFTKNNYLCSDGTAKKIQYAGH